MKVFRFMEQLMAKLTDLGFSRYRTIDPAIGDRFRRSSGCSLPGEYLKFLEFRQPSAMLLIFKFPRADGEELEGCVSEFHNIAPIGDCLDDLAEQVIQPSGSLDRKFLPIGTDPGGNWLCLDLKEDGASVVDMHYGSGTISLVAPDFQTFVGLLRPAEIGPV